MNIWDREGNQRVSLDMGSPVIDAAWSPTSSTIISCITEDRCLCTYDISISKDRPICRQKICNKDILTTLLIHPTKPIILVGTSGYVFMCMYMQLPTHILVGSLKETVLRKIRVLSALQVPYSLHEAFSQPQVP